MNPGQWQTEPNTQPEPMTSLTLRAAALALLIAPLVAGCDSGAPDAPPGIVPDSPAAPVARGQLFPVEQNGDHALIDSTGRVVVSLARYNEVGAGSEGLVPARYWDGTRTVWDFFDASGAVALTVAADGADAPRQGLIRVWVDGRSGFVGLDGRFVVNPYLNDARAFRENVARVKTTGWQWGLMDRTGRVVVQPEWGELSDLHDGRARFRDGNLYGYIDASGREAIPAVYADARLFSGGVAAVRDGQRWVYIDRANARTMGGTTFISAGDFGSGLAPVRTENLWEYVNAAGARVISPQFEAARAFVEGRAAVRIDGRWTFIDTSGATIRAPQYDEVADFSGGLAAVVSGGRTGYVNRAGNVVWIPRD